MQTVYIDIETIPGQAAWIRDYVSKRTKPPGNMSKPESIKKWEEEKKADVVENNMHKCGLDATMGEIICISWATDDDDPVVHYNLPERQLLHAFFLRLSDHLQGPHHESGATF